MMAFLQKQANSVSFLTKETVDVPVPNENLLTTEDGNALFYYLKEIRDNFKQIAGKLYNNTIKRGNVLVSTLLKLWKQSEESPQTN